MRIPVTHSKVFVDRRGRLLARLSGPALFLSGVPRVRNYPANGYPFRASSHFLYLVGQSLPGAALLLADGRATLFVRTPEPDDALWHGPSPSPDALRETLLVDEVAPLQTLSERLAPRRSDVATIAPLDEGSAVLLTELLGRPIKACSLPWAPRDVELAKAVVDVRLIHDGGAQAQLSVAGEATAAAHLAGMRHTRHAATEAEVAGAMIAELSRLCMGQSYLPIVTTHGEVLHNEDHGNALKPGDLILADVGAETKEGWAGDVTRVWPVSGRFSTTQRAIYEVVLAVQKAAITMVRSGVSYRSIHEAAGRRMVEGLRHLGIFRGDVDGLVERGAAALFFPHGIGHLLGLDVHDMEDVGDIAGYAPGRVRSQRFGDRYLRLDRELVPGMAVTIEPGFYQVPAILADPIFTGPFGSDLDRTVLARFSDVRGIRIEDDVLCTEGEPVVLTRKVPKEIAEIESVVQEG